MMVKYTQYLLFLMVVCLFTNCSTKRKVVGLWQIESVKVGSEEMTPVAKWTRLNKDNTQESGNGWFQHSVGTWEMARKTEEISISNTNGMVDDYGGFVVNMENEKMKWKRLEEGNEVEVTLVRIEKIPPAPANQLLGVWKLLGNQEETPDSAFQYLFVRWDQIIVLRTIEGKRKYGMYKTHGHKQEVQVIHYEDPLRSEIWNYSLKGDNRLTLNFEHKGENVRLEYERVYDFPN